MIKIPVYRNGLIAAFAMIDDEMQEALFPHRKWQLDHKGYAVLSISIETREQARLNNRKHRRKSAYRMHRYIMNVSDPQIQVDHIDKNKLNNQRANLRLVTNAENAQNRNSNRNTKSRYRGVTWNENNKKWGVLHTLNGTKYTLGLYVNEYDAAVVAYKWRQENMPFSVEDFPMP